MSHSSEERLSADLLAVAEQLSEGKHEASAVDLDRIKMRAMAKATRGSATFAPRKGSLMRKRSLLTTLLVVGTLASGTGATMAVTGQFSQARDDRPTASASQYADCRFVKRENRAGRVRDRRLNRQQHKRKQRANNRSERLIRNPRTRRSVRKNNVRDEKRQRRAFRRSERRQREADRDEERRCREGRSR